MNVLVKYLGGLVFGFKRKDMPENIDRILFIKTGAIGDILMTTPLIRAVRTKFPSAIIDYACGRSFSSVLRGNRNINYVIEFDEKIFFERKIGELRKLAKKLRENNYDIIIVLDKHWAAGVFAAFAGKFRIGFDRYGEGFANNANVIYKQNKHDIDSYLDICVYLRTKIQGKKMDIKVSDVDKRKAKKICQGKCIAVLAGGGVNTGQEAKIKIWPKERYANVIQALSKKYTVILLGSKNDRKITDWICKQIGRKGHVKNFCGKTTLSESAAILGYCNFVICNDSGGMHLASSVNEKIISLFGPTNPHVLAPLNPESVFIWKEKSACYDIFGNFDKCTTNLIMEKITVEDVLNASRSYW